MYGTNLLKVINTQPKGEEYNYYYLRLNCDVLDYFSMKLCKYVTDYILYAQKLCLQWVDFEFSLRIVVYLIVKWPV